MKGGVLKNLKFFKIFQPLCAAKILRDRVTRSLTTRHALRSSCNASLDRRLVRHSHSGPSIMLICRLMLRHLNKNCVMSMQQCTQRHAQRQRGSISAGSIGSCLISGRDNCGATTVDRIGGSTTAWQLSTLSSSAALASPTPTPSPLSSSSPLTLGQANMCKPC